MKRILFIAPDSVGIIKIIVSTLNLRTDFKTDYINIDAFKNKFSYKNLNHRIGNFFSKTFKGVNYKSVFFNNLIKEEINKQQSSYDRIVIIRPDLLSDEVLHLLKSKTNNFIAYYWDSIAYFPRKAVIKNMFTKVYSFDLEDCIKYNLALLTNFYYYENIPLEIKNNVYCLVSLDQRKTLLEKIGKYLTDNNISNTIKLFCNRKPFDSNYLIAVQEVVSYEKMLEEIAHSSILLEVQKEKQRGLTFRPFEALGLKKKLITNNPLIKQYDFYNFNNIFVIDENNLEIPSSFFSTPYQEIDEAIKKKYHLNNWIETLFVK